MLLSGMGGALLYASQRFIGIDFGEATMITQRMGIDPLRSRMGCPTSGVGLRPRRATKPLKVTIGTVTMNRHELVYAYAVPKEAESSREFSAQKLLYEMNLIPSIDFATAWNPYGFGICCPTEYHHYIEEFADACAESRVHIHLTPPTQWQDIRLKVYSGTVPPVVVNDWEKLDFDRRRRA